MNIVIYFAVAIAVAFITAYVKQIRPDFALCISLAAIILMFSAAVPRIAILIADIRSLTVINGVSMEYITPVLKIIGITYVTHLASDICHDTGEHALSNHVETLGKVAVVFITLPIVEDVFEMILGLLE